MRRTGIRSAALAAALIPLAATALPVAVRAESGGLPQLDAGSYPTQIFWLVVSFTILYLLLSKLAIPRISEVLEERQERITDDLEKAQRLKDEADGVHTRYEQALAAARQQAAGLLREAAGTAAEDAARAEAAAADRNADSLAAAETRILAARRAAQDNIRSVAAEVAAAALDRLIGARIGPEAAGRAVDAAMAERPIGASTTEGPGR